MKRSYSVAEACEYLSIGKTLCYSLLNNKKIKARKIGEKRTVIFKEDLDDFLDKLDHYTPQSGGDDE